MDKLKGYIYNKKEDEIVLKQVVKEICDNVYNYS